MATTIAEREAAAHTKEVKSAEALRKWAQAARPGASVVYFRSTRARYKTDMTTGEQTPLGTVDDLFKQAAKLSDQRAVMLFQRKIGTESGWDKDIRFEYLAVRTTRRTVETVAMYAKRFYCEAPVFGYLTADPFPAYRQRGKDYETSLEEFTNG